MAEFVADFLFDEAVEIIPPEGRDEKEDSRHLFMLPRVSRWMDDDGCGICDECLTA